MKTQLLLLDVPFRYRSLYQPRHVLLRLLLRTVRDPLELIQSAGGREQGVKLEQVAIARRHSDARGHVARIWCCDPAEARVGARSGLVVLRLGIAARRMCIGVAGCIAASRDEGRVAPDDDVARGASEHRSTALFFLGAVFGEPLKTELKRVR